MGGTGVIDHFLEVFTRYIDSGFGLLGGEVAFIATTLIVIDMTLAGAVLGVGRRRGHHRAPGEEDPLRRLLRLHHRNWNSSGQDRLRELCRSGAEGLRHRLFGRRSSASRPASRRSASTPGGRCSIDLRPDGLHQLLRELHPDRGAAVRLGDGAARLLHPRGPALRHADRVQADDARRLRPDPFGLFGKTAFLAERVLGNVVSSGVKVLVLAVIVGIGSTLVLRSSPRASAAISRPSRMRMAIVLAALVAARPRHLRARHRQRPGLRRAAARRGRGGRHRPRRRRRGHGGRRGAPAWPRGERAPLSAQPPPPRAAARPWLAARPPPTASHRPDRAGAAGVASGLGGVARAGAGAAAHRVQRAAGSAADAMAESFAAAREPPSQRPAAHRPWARSAGVRRATRLAATSIVRPPGRSA